MIAYHVVTERPMLVFYWISVLQIHINAMELDKSCWKWEF